MCTLCCRSYGCTTWGQQHKALCEILVHNISSKSLQNCCFFPSFSGNGHSHFPKAHKGCDIAPNWCRAPRVLCVVLLHQSRLCFWQNPSGSELSWARNSVFLLGLGILGPTGTWSSSTASRVRFLGTEGRVSGQAGSFEGHLKQEIVNWDMFMSLAAL